MFPLGLTAHTFKKKRELYGLKGGTLLRNLGVTRATRRSSQG